MLAWKQVDIITKGPSAYESILLPEDTIKFEVGFRGDLVLEPDRQPLQTLLRDAYNIVPGLTPLTEREKCGTIEHPNPRCAASV
jgi:hypothetical protein